MLTTRTLIGGALLVAASIGWAMRSFVLHASEQDAEQRTTDESAPEIAAKDLSVRVSTVEATEGDLPLVALAPGIVRAAPTAERVLTSRAGGRVLETFVSIGSRVKQGDLIARFETGPLEAALAATRAELARTENQLAEFDRIGRDRQAVELQAAASRTASQRRLLDQQLARLAPLHADGLISDKTLAESAQAAEQARVEQELADRAASAFQTSGSELAHATLVAAALSARSNVREAELGLAEAETRAPADGQIGAFVIRAGERVEPGAMIGRLLVSAARAVCFDLTPSRALGISLGAPVTWEAATGEHGFGEVVNIAGEVDVGSGTITVLVAPDPRSPSMSPGLSVMGELELRRLRAVVLVPDRAVVRADDRRVVAIASADGLARIVEVTLLGRYRDLVAIDGTVRRGDRVIVDGNYNLPDGARIVDVGGATSIQSEHIGDARPLGRGRGLIEDWK